MAHLEDFIIAQFSDTFGVEVVDFESELTNTTTTPVVSIAYTVEVVFADTSTFIPTTEELDVLVQLAFLEPPVFDLLTDLRSLPSDSPFSSTESVEYFLLEGKLRVGATPRDRLSAVQLTLITGASAILLAAVALLSMRWRTGRIEAKFSTVTSSKVQDIPVLMPAHSYGYSILSSHSENIMQFRDDTGSTASSGSLCGFVSVQSIPSETAHLYARQLIPSSALASTQSLASEGKRVNPYYSGELDIRPI